ncbi:sigma-70 family RNA polymerase sigma factor [Clostridium sp.]|uniref:sigma-70 family RNA polymerase sigma factor n=1 Tax=Clostridium sp. TaxID=1506 RepID=UPI00290F3389|nr:sigma-70 family RNA polymerase sigma factor [Clostridium sp.]MDU4724843.1 sigma-70 family RNA polymerase sigma factor [Clostridium sp.]
MSNEELVQLYQNGDNKALDELIQANEGVIYKIANKYNGINRELELEDLYQNGVLGLIAAAKKYKFDIEKKAKFITYAIHYINRYINTCVNGRTSKDIENNKFYNNCTSLNIPIGEGEDREFGECIEDVDYGFENVEERLYLKKLREDLEKVMLENTTLQERDILKLHYGWDFKACSLECIGNLYGVTRSRVQQIESIAIRKIRKTKWARVEAEKYYSLKLSYRNVERKIDIDYDAIYPRRKINFIEKYFEGVNF